MKIEKQLFGVNYVFTDEIEVTLIQKSGSDNMVVAAAKVSTKPQEVKELASKKSKTECAGLINFLMKNRHGTPFEHGLMTFFVDAPIFVWREWHRHRIGFSYNEESGRWSKLRPKFWVPGLDRPMLPSPDYKPSKPVNIILENTEKYQRIIDNKIDTYITAYEEYLQEYEDCGIVKEVARSNLPVGIYSRCWVTCNPRSMMAFLSLRTHDPDARFVSWPQYEIQNAAKQCENIFKKHWPLTWKAFQENGRVGP